MRHPATAVVALTATAILTTACAPRLVEALPAPVPEKPGVIAQQETITLRDSPAVSNGIVTVTRMDHSVITTIDVATTTYVAPRWFRTEDGGKALMERMCVLRDGSQENGVWHNAVIWNEYNISGKTFAILMSVRNQHDAHPVDFGTMVYQLTIDGKQVGSMTNALVDPSAGAIAGARVGELGAVLPGQTATVRIHSIPLAALPMGATVAGAIALYRVPTSLDATGKVTATGNMTYPFTIYRRMEEKVMPATFYEFFWNTRNLPFHRSRGVTNTLPYDIRQRVRTHKDHSSGMIGKFLHEDAPREDYLPSEQARIAAVRQRIITAGDQIADPATAAAAAP
jgi:hypothetical protein